MLPSAIPAQWAQLVEPERLCVDGGNRVVSLTFAAGHDQAIAATAGAPAWRTLEALRLPPSTQQSAALAVALHPSVERLTRLYGLSWPDFSVLCKHPLSLSLETVSFELRDWVHFLARFRNARSLPKLKELQFSALGALPISSLSYEARRLGRPLSRLRVTTGDGFFERRNSIRLLVQEEGNEVVCDARTRHDVDRAVLLNVCKNFGLPAPLSVGRIED